METIALTLPALAYIAYLEISGRSHFFRSGVRPALLLVLAGAVTSMPLLWYTEAARRMPLSTLGVLQYLSPSMQFCLAVFVFEEHFSTAHLVTFGAIWSALLLFSVESFVMYRSAGSVRSRALRTGRNSHV